MYSKGISWIDDCRIPFVDDGDMMKPTIATRDEFNDYKKTEGRQNIRQGGGFIKQSNTQGRFPANILVCDDMLNDGNIGQNNSKNQEWKLQYKSESHIYGKYKGAGISRIADKGSNSRYYNIDKWFNNLIDV
jgi:hypothetical protein